MDPRGGPCRAGRPAAPDAAARAAPWTLRFCEPVNALFTDATPSHTPLPLHLSLNAHRLRGLWGRHGASREAARERPTTTRSGRGARKPRPGASRADSGRAGRPGPREPGWGRGSGTGLAIGRLGSSPAWLLAKQLLTTGELCTFVYLFWAYCLEKV